MALQPRNPERFAHATQPGTTPTAIAGRLSQDIAASVEMLHKTGEMNSKMRLMVEIQLNPLVKEVVRKAEQHSAKLNSTDNQAALETF